LRKKVLITAPYVRLDIEKLRHIFIENDIDITVPDITEKIPEDELFAVIDQYDGAICGDDPFNRRVLEKAKKLKVISKWGTGIDSIDLKAAADLGIKVCNTPNAFSHPVADTALAFMLAFARNVLATDKEMKQGVWHKRSGFTLSERTLGIIGLGNIGTQVAKRARAFNMKVIANDIKEIQPIILEQYDIRMTTKEDIYENADIITIHCDLNESSYHLLNKKTFDQMKRKPYIINTARGGHIAHEDLLAALEGGLISGAGLDVFEEEPLPANDPMLLRDDVILAPHNSNNSPKYWELVHKNTIKNLLLHLER